MSKSYNDCCCNYGGGYGGGNSSYSNIYSLLILILIVLQFTKCKKFFHDDDECDHDEHECEHGLIDNSVLFIIAIFLLIYCSCGKKGYGGMMGGMMGCGGC